MVSAGPGTVTSSSSSDPLQVGVCLHDNDGEQGLVDVGDTAAALAKLLPTQHFAGGWSALPSE